MRNRRGFTVSSFSMWVFLLFVAVAAAHLLYAMNDPRWRTSALVRFILTFTVWPLVAVAALTIGAWFVSRRSDRVGNFVLCLLLLILTGLRVAVMAGVLARGGQRSSPGPSLAPGPPISPPPATSPRSETPRPQVPIKTATAPTGAHPTLPTPPAPVSDAPASSPRVQSALDAIQSEIAAEVEALWPDVEAAFAAWANVPRHDVRDLDARKSQASDLKAVSEKLGKRLRELSREAQTRMVDAGVESATAQAESGRFMVTYRSSWRATACDSIGRAADRIIEESEFLKQGFSSWSIDAKGEISSKDFAFKGRANGLRSSAEFAVRDKDSLRKRLDEGE